MLPVFYIWQTFSMCPFTLKRENFEPKLNAIHKVTAAVSLTIQIFVFIHGIFYSEIYIDYSSSFILYFIDILRLSLYRSIAIAIVIESYLKSSQQIKFLQMIEDADEILVKDLRLNIKWEAACKENLKRLLFQFFYFVLTSVTMIYVVKTVGVAANFDIYWYFVSFPIFLCIMRYHQATCYFYLISDRYIAINEYLDSMRSNNSEFSVSEAIFTICRGKNTKLQCSQSIMTIKQLKQIKMVHHLLYESSTMVCGLFNWSMILIFFNDVINALANIYWNILEMVDGRSGFGLVPGFLWAGLNIWLFITILTACGSVESEVVYNRKF